MNINDVRTICNNHNITASEITSLTGGFDKEIYIIDNHHVLRPSLSGMEKEQVNFRRISSLNNVPRLEFTGTYQSMEKYYYTILSMLPGIDFIDAVADMTIEQNEQLGFLVSAFLDTLHSIIGTTYDIGHYIPIVADHAGSWKSGHEQYLSYLSIGIEKVALSGYSREIVTEAFSYIYSTKDVLDFQVGPVLLHNDLHPKNIIVHNGTFTGIIDWECSQFGEPDFEMCHLVHWCLYPPKADADFKPFLRSLFESTPKCIKVPNISQRLSIYELEHEIAQLIWSNGASESDRIPRLRKWVEGGVEQLLKGL